eukprot:scaffold19514_cov57-Phaeocystis_antarctica.AAC.4
MIVSILSVATVGACVVCIACILSALHVLSLPPVSAKRAPTKLFRGPRHNRACGTAIAANAWRASGPTLSPRAGAR